MDIEYNSDGYVFEITNELGERFELGYNEQNELVSSQTNNGNISFDYGEYGLIYAINAAGEEVNYSYDSLARLSSAKSLLEAR